NHRHAIIKRDGELAGVRWLTGCLLVQRTTTVASSGISRSTNVVGCNNRAVSFGSSDCRELRVYDGGHSASSCIASGFCFGCCCLRRRLNGRTGKVRGKPELITLLEAPYDHASSKSCGSHVIPGNRLDRQHRATVKAHRDG